jgi:DNA-binding HxlR family transcriptional regulator
VHEEAEDDMPLRSDWSDELCPIRRSLDVLGDPWVLLIVRDVLQGVSRFDDLRDSLRIADSVLSRRLRAMVEAGLLSRVEYADAARTRHAYVATQAAADLLPILQQLLIWGEKHTVLPDGGGPMIMVHAPCGSETSRSEVCSACGTMLVAEDMIWDKTWKGSRSHLVAPGVLATAG